MSEISKYENILEKFKKNQYDGYKDLKDDIIKMAKLKGDKNVVEALKDSGKIETAYQRLLRQMNDLKAYPDTPVWKVKEFPACTISKNCIKINKSEFLDNDFLFTLKTFYNILDKEIDAFKGKDDSQKQVVRALSNLAKKELNRATTEFSKASAGTVEANNIEMLTFFDDMAKDNEGHCVPCFHTANGYYQISSEENIIKQFTQKVIKVFVLVDKNILWSKIPSCEWYKCSVEGNPANLENIHNAGVVKIINTFTPTGFTFEDNKLFVQ